MVPPLAKRMVPHPTISLSLRIRVCHPNTRIHVRLLGPCFKTGRMKPFRQHPKNGEIDPQKGVPLNSLHAVYRKTLQPATRRQANCATEVLSPSTGYRHVQRLKISFAGWPPPQVLSTETNCRWPAKKCYRKYTTLNNHGRRLSLRILGRMTDSNRFPF